MDSASTSPALESEALSKTYGSTAALSSISLSIPFGTIHGLLGRNGAGKSTFLKICAGIIPPTSGRVKIGGHDMALRPIEAKRLIGYVPESAALYDALTLGEHLTLLADLHELDRADADANRAALTAAFELGPVLAKPIAQLSKGMKQRVMIAGALLHRPAVLLLDEPLDGLDPVTAEMLKAQLTVHAAAGGAILLCTHMLDVVRELCVAVSVLDNGTLVLASGPPGAAMAAMSRGAATA